MTKRMEATWLLRQHMDERRLSSTSDLVPLLAERGIHLSRMQVYRLVMQEPQRLSLDLLAALCDIFDCSPNDLIRINVVNRQQRKRIAGGDEKIAPTNIKPVRANIRRPHE